MFNSLHVVVLLHYYVYSVYHNKMSHRRRKVLNIGARGGGGARFRILEGWGGGGKLFALAIN